MANKRYYWLKLKEDFFRNKQIKKLRKIAGGDTYVIIYLKMQLESLKTNGCLYYDGVEDDFCSELALDLDEDVENVKMTVLFLMNHDLLEQREEDSYFMMEVPNVTGSESYSTERMRRLRSNRASQCDALESHCDKDVRSCDEEKDVEKRDKIEEKEKIYSPAKAEQYDEIISYLNEKAGTNYKSNSKATQNHINARLNEGYTVDNFKTVIDIKCNEWLNNKDMKKYLRPETLFGTKFEGYLNQQPKRHEETKPNILDELF